MISFSRASRKQTWAQLQNLFRQRYSKLGNTCKQLFHAWRSCTFDENTETIDSYVIRIRQVATLLGYGELKILNVFKNTLLTKLYWILFPIEDLRQAIDTAKRILTKEKLDKWLTGQTSTSPFMSVRDGTDRRVSFNTRDELGDKIDKLTVVMSKLAAIDSHKESPLSHEYTRVEDKVDFIVKEHTKPGQIMETGDIVQIIIQGKIIEATNLEEISEGIVDKIIEKITGMKDMIITLEIEIGQGKELLQGVMVMEEIEALAMTGLDQGPELVQIEIEQGATCTENMIIL